MKNKYTIEELLTYLKNNRILLVNGEELGGVEVPEIDEAFILDDDKDNSIIQ